MQFLQFEYDRSVYLREVTIYETYTGGALKRVYAKSYEGRWTLLWTGSSYCYTYARNFSVSLDVCKTKI